METFAFDPASTILEATGHDEHCIGVLGGTRAAPLLDNLLRDYAGTQFKYDERGNLRRRSSVTLHASAGITNRLRFPGQYHDQGSGLHYNRHRYYDPNTGRYLTKDPIGLLGGLNQYEHVHGNPIQAIDPLGLRTGPVLLGLGNVYRADVMPPLPSMAQNSAVASLIGEASNSPFSAKDLPRE